MSGLLKPLRRGVWRYLSDRDILLAALVTAIVFVGSLGLVYVAHAVRVWRLARHSPAMSPRRGTLLIFGRRLVDDRPEFDFIARLTCARDNARSGRADRVLLIGGFSGGTVSEAEAGRRWLVAEGWPDDVPLLLEQMSIDSLENLRHARELLRPAGGSDLPAVSLVTSRYHLARCMYLARRLGYWGPVLTGLGLAVVGFGWLSTTSAGTTEAQLIVPLALCGVGAGIANGGLTGVAVMSEGRHRLDEAAGMLSLSRFVGSALAIAIGTTTYLSVAATQPLEGVETSRPPDEVAIGGSAFHEVVAQLRQDLRAPFEAAARSQSAEAFATTMRLAAVMLLLLTLLSVWLLRPTRRSPDIGPPSNR